ncbi:MAG: hypothetical protein L0Y50_11775 [Beijerinckiaceae bacterium]|nr:hypothetical protein [Beijerinckiaceae bacterium]MCI0736927.1 hypothetical protein [Beijerinckiaceae bacterium]
MGAFEHLKTLCCLGLPPESAMVAVTPLLHEIIPHGWYRVILFEPDATIRSGYAENPETGAILREHAWRFMDDPSSIAFLMKPCFLANAIGWTLHLQGRGWTNSNWYRDVEAPLDSCWILDAMIGDSRKTLAWINLTRPRSARPYTVDDVQRFDRLRPWLAHAFRQHPPGDAQEDQVLAGVAGAPVLSGQIILTSDSRIIFQTPAVEHLLMALEGGPGNFTRHLPARDRLPAPVLKLLKRIVGAANGGLGEPPRMQLSTPYGTVTLEAKWLVPAGAIPSDVAKDPKGCLIAVTIELREHAIAQAARSLRESGATPAQTKVGIQLAMGKTRPAIADELGIKLSTIADLTKKLYQTLDVHNAAGLTTKIWLGQTQTRTNGKTAAAGMLRAAAG